MLKRFDVHVGEDSDGFYIHKEYNADGHYCKAEDANKAIDEAIAHARIISLQEAAKILIARDEYFAAKIVLEMSGKLLQDCKIQSGT